MQSINEQLEQSTDEIARLSARLALVIEENRWLKQQLFGRSSEKRSSQEVFPDQARLLFNEAEASPNAPASITIASHV